MRMRVLFGALHVRCSGGALSVSWSVYLFQEESLSPEDESAWENGTRVDSKWLGEYNFTYGNRPSVDGLKVIALCDAICRYFLLQYRSGEV